MEWRDHPCSEIVVEDERNNISEEFGFRNIVIEVDTGKFWIKWVMREGSQLVWQFVPGEVGGRCISRAVYLGEERTLSQSLVEVKTP